MKDEQQDDVTKGFGQWVPLHDLALSHFPEYDQPPGVYALRDASTGEILKFGKASCLRTRIIGQYLCGFCNGTSERIHNDLIYSGMIERVEFAWIGTKDAKEAGQMEKEFRAKHKRRNGRRPAWDRQD
jgi:excinuclease UvrABC nuclease subunit